MGLMTTEANHMRKSHRIDLPISVQVGGLVYKARDWSMTGIALDSYKEPLQAEQVVDANLLLPMNASALILNVKLKFKRQMKTFAGFEFVDLQPQVRRVLRQYIELAVDGKLDNLEDMVGVLTTAAIDSPLDNALTLSDVEQDSMIEHFKNGSRAAIAMGVVLFVVIVSSLLYTTNYRVSGTGMVSNTLQAMRAPVAGLVQGLQLKRGATVKAGETVFYVNPVLQQTASSISYRGQSNEQLTHELAKAVRAQEREYAKVKKLYAKHIVSLKDVNYIAAQLRKSRIAYARFTGVDYGSKVTHVDAVVNQTLPVQAVKDGRIFSIDIDQGLYVNAGDVVLVMEVDVTPDIIYKVKNYDAIKIHVGMPATIKLPYNGEKMEAVISAIGYRAVYGKSTPTAEASMNETLIKLELKDTNVRLPANTRVNVWIKTFEWPWPFDS